MTTPQPRALDPQISLAMSMQSQPGVYALLIGSGTSTGAGVLTGWGVIKDLVAKAASAAGESLGDSPTDGQIEDWWATHGDGNDLGYSGLLAELGRTAAARSALLAGYFQATEEERAEGVKVPGKAHHGIAALAARGSVQVILTTNFDGLIEQALDAAGVAFQVVSTEAAAEAKEPLVHAGCTVVKINGDYRSLSQRNTVEELSEYGPAMKDLLAEVFENYGLVINGWSADWDHALVEAIRGRRTRRYPLYWSTLHGLGTPAKSLVAQHGAGIIEDITADEFFPGLVQRLEALDSLAAPPLTEEIAVARLKKLLPYRESYIEIRDLLDVELNRIRKAVEDRPQIFPLQENGLVDAGAVEAECGRLRAECQILLRLISTGVMLDRDRVETDVWVWALQRLLDARQFPNGSHNPVWMALGHYPALLVLRTIAMVAVTFDREDVFIRAASEPRWRDQYASSTPEPAFSVLQDYRVLDHDIVNAFPRWNGTTWIYPRSELLEEDLRSIIEPLLGSNREYMASLYRAEYRMAMAQMFLDGGQQRPRPSPGQYCFDSQWSSDDGNKLASETDFRERGDHSAWGWEKVPGDVPDEFDAKLTQLSEHLAAFPRW